MRARPLATRKEKRSEREEDKRAQEERLGKGKREQSLRQGRTGPLRLAQRTKCKYQVPRPVSGTELRYLSEAAQKARFASRGAASCLPLPVRSTTDGRGLWDRLDAKAELFDCSNEGAGAFASQPSQDGRGCGRG